MIRHEARFARNPRMVLPYRNLERLTPADRAAVRAEAERIKTDFGAVRV